MPFFVSLYYWCFRKNIINFSFPIIDKPLKIKILINAYVLWYDGLHEKIHQTPKIIFIFSSFVKRHSMSILQDGSFPWNIYFAISVMAKSLDLNSACYYIFRFPSMIVYMIEFHESKFANIKFFVAKLNWVYISIL